MQRILNEPATWQEHPRHRRAGERIATSNLRCLAEDALRIASETEDATDRVDLLIRAAELLELELRKEAGASSAVA